MTKVVEETVSPTNSTGTSEPFERNSDSDVTTVGDDIAGATAPSDLKLLERSDSRASITLPPIQHVLRTIDDYQNQQKLQDSELLLAFGERNNSTGHVNVPSQDGGSEDEPSQPRSLSNPPSFDSHPHMRTSYSSPQLQTVSGLKDTNATTTSASGKPRPGRPQRSQSYVNKKTKTGESSRASSLESTDSASSSGANTPNSTNSKKRTNLPRETIEILNDWIVNNLDNPYPNHTQKRMLLEKTGLSNVQLSNWFINKRRRRLFSNLSGNQGYPIKKKRLIDRI